jgi:lysophospholipase L1-like esterase
MSSPTGFRDSALSALPSATAVTALILGWQVLVARSLETKVRQHLSMCGRLLMVYPLAAVLFFIIGNQAWWLMPVGVLFLATPLEHQRAELRRYGWHMLASFCLFLLFLEASVTHGPVASYARPLRMGAQYRPADNLLWIPDNLAPGTDRGLYLHEMPIMERLSFRGHEGLSSGKPPCVFRILLLGGSNAWGHGQPTNDTTFAGLLERSLRARSWNAEVINAGFCGYRSFQSLLVLKQIGRLYRPDVVIFYGGRNDQSNPRGPYTYRQLAGLDRGNPNVLAVQRSLQRGGLYNLLTTGIVAARGRVLEQFDLPVFRETNPPSDYRRNLADMADVARQLGAKMVFAQEFFGLNLSDMETNAEWLELFNSMKETAAANGALFLDAYHYFANQPEPLRHVLPDDPVHFNAAGHAAMARYLEQALTDNGALPARAPCAPAIAAAGAQ